MAYGTVAADVISNSVAGSSIGAGNASIMKNRIINGAMVIDQRNAGASVTITTAEEYIVDRFNFAPSSSSKLTGQQSTTAPAGFSNSILLTSTAATSVASGDYYFMQHKVEGFNFADCNWGTADAKTVTLSFWCRSSVTGTYGGALVNSAQNRSYPFTYTISVANTWEQKTITVAGDTSGTWVGATNGIGVRLRLGFGVGSTYSGTAGSWASASYFSATGATNWISTNGATFYITGVQLEVGSSATGYEYRQYGTELALCQRYFVTLLGSGSYSRAGFGIANGSTSCVIGISQPVAMRTGPTIAYSGSIGLYNGSTITNATSFSVDYTDLIYSTVVVNVTSGLSAGFPYQLLSAANTTARITLSSEL